MKKWQIENSEKSEISEISEKLFRVFFFPSFRLFPTAKIKNSDLKISEKIYEISEISEVSEFWAWLKSNRVFTKEINKKVLNTLSVHKPLFSKQLSL